MAYNWDSEPECIECNCFNIGQVTCQDCINNLINNWRIMLDSPDFNDNDAGLVREEMDNYLASHNHGKVKR